MRNTLKFLAAAALVAAALPVAAQQLRFYTETPYTFFTKDDHKVLDAALTESLTKAADGETKTWSGPSGAGGEIKVVKSYENKGQKCRTLAIANKAKGRSNAGEYNFCMAGKGQKGRFGGWAFAGV
jgi:hypothetical protein